MSNRTAIAARIAEKVNAQTETEAAAIYSGLRMIVMKERKLGNKAPEGAATAMEMAGEALEARIGEDRFFNLIDQIDAQVYA